jgi:hypothetical protein
LNAKQANLSATSIITNTTTRPYPPSYLTASSTTFTTTFYGRGTFIATAGSDYPGQELFYAFGSAPSTNPTFSQWTSAFGNFNSTGDYVKTKTTIINGVSTSGETVTLQLPYLVVMTSYSLTSAYTPYNYYMMRDWIFCGSTDGINYTQLDSRTGIFWATFTTNTYSFTNTTQYLYYRIVIKKTSNFVQPSTYSATVCDGIVFNGYEIKNGASIETVGIGTTATNNASLLVYGTTNLIGNVGINTTGGVGSLLEISDGTNKMKIGGTNGGAHHMTTNNAFVINSSVVGGTIAIFRNLANGYDNLSGYNDRMTISSTGVNINQALIVGTTSTFNNSIYMKTNVWNYSTDSQQRLYFQDYSTTYIQGQSTTPVVFRNNANSDLGNFSSSGDFTATASISTGASSYLYAGGLRIGGFDTGNTIYQANGNIGITLNYTNTPSGSINLGFYGGNGNILSVNNNGVSISKSLTTNNYSCSASTTTGRLQLCSDGVTRAGFYIPMNGWWYLGYSYLTISLSFQI